jgi:hypothetical protein
MTLERWLKKIDAGYGDLKPSGAVQVPLWVTHVCRLTYFLGKKAGRAEERRKLSKRIGIKP